MEHWFTQTPLGLVVLGLVTIFLAALVARIAGKFWRAYLEARVVGRGVRFLEAYVRSFAISRVLTNRYIHNKDYFRYVAHTAFAIMAFALSTVVELLVFALIAIYLIVNGIRFSWTLFVLFSLSGVFLLPWFKDVFYLYGVMEQTFLKDLETYKRLFPKLHPTFLMRLMTEDIEDVLKQQEAASKAELKEKAIKANSTNASQAGP